jgi:hypothetical protein
MADMAVPKLAKHEVAGFFEDGFIHLPALFSPAQCARWRADVMGRCAEPPPNWRAATTDRNGQLGATGHAGLGNAGAPDGSRGRLQAGVRYEPATAGVDAANPNGLLFVQGTPSIYEGREVIHHVPALLYTGNP